MKLQEEILKHPRLVATLKYAHLAGKLIYSTQTEEHQKADLEQYTYERHGYSCEDITGVWNPDSVGAWFKCQLENFKSYYEDFGFLSALGSLSLRLPWSGWVWVIDSKNTIIHEIAMEKWRKVSKNEKTATKYDDLVKAVCPVEVITYLNEHYVLLNENLWVSKTDPSVMVFDEGAKPFKYKDGWSKEQLGEILAYWYESIMEEKITPEYQEGLAW